MNNEFIKKSQDLFDTSNKWHSFITLVNHKNEISNQWLLKLKNEAEAYFNSKGKVDGWQFVSNHLFDMHWYLKEFGNKSISLYLGWGGEFNLMFFDNFSTKEKVKETIEKNDKYSALSLQFDRIDARFWENRIYLEKRNFSFDSPYDKNFDLENLSWYAGNKTENFIKQLETKVNKFRLDKHIENLLKELNSEVLSINN